MKRAHRIRALVAAAVVISVLLVGLMGLAAAYGERSDKCAQVGYDGVDAWIEQGLWWDDAAFWDEMRQRGHTVEEARACRADQLRDLLWNGAWPRWYEHWDESG